PPHPRSPLFPYTTLFRSSSEFHLWIFGLSLPGTGTSTSLSVAPSPSGFGQSVTATATVTPTDGGGAVAFYANNTPIAGCSAQPRSEEHTSELQSRGHLVC